MRRTAAGDMADRIPVDAMPKDIKAELQQVRT